MSAAGKYMCRTEYGYIHHCPGCGSRHSIAVDKPLHNKSQWHFNGNLEEPTFTPSVVIFEHGDEEIKPERCHYFISKGQIRFLQDCTHDLAGKTVDMVQINDSELRGVDRYLEDEPFQEEEG